VAAALEARLNQSDNTVNAAISRRKQEQEQERVHQQQRNKIIDTLQETITQKLDTWKHTHIHTSTSKDQKSLHGSLGNGNASANDGARRLKSIIELLTDLPALIDHVPPPTGCAIISNQSDLNEVS
jgi:hypothetical protein